MQVRKFLEWQDRHMRVLAGTTALFALVVAVFATVSATSTWVKFLVLAVVGWSALMMLLVLINAVGWTWVLRNAFR